MRKFTAAVVLLTAACAAQPAPEYHTLQGCFSLRGAQQSDCIRRVVHETMDVAEARGLAQQEQRHPLPIDKLHGHGLAAVPLPVPDTTADDWLFCQAIGRKAWDHYTCFNSMSH